MNKTKIESDGSSASPFKPQKKHGNDKRTRLGNYAKQTLGKGSFEQAVKLPEGEILGDWLATNCVEVYNEISLLYGTLTEFCTKETCPVMSAGPRYEYLWADGKKVTKPIKCSAPEYVEYLMDWVDSQISDPKTFPVDPHAKFPSNFISVVKTICKRLFRIYAHMYRSHAATVQELGMNAYLNTCFKHFLYLSEEFNLVDPRELVPLEDYVQVSLGRPYRKKKSSRRSRSKKNHSAGQTSHKSKAHSTPQTKSSSHSEVESKRSSVLVQSKSLHSLQSASSGSGSIPLSPEQEKSPTAENESRMEETSDTKTKTEETELSSVERNSPADIRRRFQMLKQKFSQDEVAPMKSKWHWSSTDDLLPSSKSKSKSPFGAPKSCPPLSESARAHSSKSLASRGSTTIDPKIRNLLQESGDLRDANSALEQSNKELLSKLEALQKHFDEKCSQYNESEKKRSKLEKQLRAAEKQNKLLETDIQQLEETIAKGEQDLFTLANTTESLNSERKSLMNELRLAKEEVTKLKANNENLVLLFKASQAASRNITIRRQSSSSNSSPRADRKRPGSIKNFQETCE